MHVGNARYLKREDLPETVPVFPLTGALLLPGGQLPLNIFEPRYLAMFDAALAGNRLIGIVQPSLLESGEAAEGPRAPLSTVGCIGRITSFAETGDGRYITSISGICRFRLIEEVGMGHPYRTFKIAPMMTDLSTEDDEGTVDRAELLRVFRAYLDANKLEADWESVERAGNRTLVNSLSMMSPFGPAEKQALLEAPDLRTRAETLIAITEILLARDFGDSDTMLQ
ncbi:LON peptidase substrate-binding domain-containing protein [Neorhizobium galegae]|jgi:Lon protease-like protein|uniref:LON peptidase substrate-binding domain-containing protein n=1 Tax=Neorhizobium galegae TaxID=399 RepID=UPI000620EF3D|nr:LON peptidase substrate-binding domain-containing protein [Neorhizobium galegae]CDZ59199.1 Peptidase S16 lon domain protein [Neorhizobium galegae bv. orientalis]KAB1123323.1 peptidase S16 [Neorhizobium galegae]MCQ1569306.1 LON peptidase substrate-binding domain-containing protein [Neorhizobium galegae]MCQ1807123.1 LON peptidase substrate-binding domain-containing protein [Neorhizobium galegae]MCQ1837288.1 LON peptidase substrate-binding domain-containing protein [Neorhizobium galegae]